MRLFLSLALVLLPVAGECQQRHSDGLDDVLQHVPMATVFTMKAAGVHSQSNWTGLAIAAVGAYAVGAATTYSLKHIACERRPDGSDDKSFPSGHATFAFAGASVLHHEYGHLSPWVTVGAYSFATLVAARRIAADRHYLHDVCAGAAIGVAATELSYFLRKKIIRNDDIDVAFSAQNIYFAVRW